MYLPRVNSVIKSKPLDIVFKGYNKNVVIDSGELSDCKNLTTDNFPILSPRLPRFLNNTLASATALFTANGVLCFVDGTSFKYNGVTKGTVTSGEKSMVEFNGHIVIFPDKKMYNYKTDTFSTIGSGTYPTAGSCPDMDYITTHQNRIFGVKDNVIYMCALGDATDWTTFDNTESQAGATTISQVKEFVGITAYQQHVVLFTSNETLELYGSNPPYTVKEAFKKGCTNIKSVKEVNGLLYFLSQDGVNVYGGGMPRLISNNLNEIQYVSGVAGTDGRKYYISLYNGSTYTLFVYDTYYDIWIKEDNLQVLDFAYLNDFLYALASDNNTYNLNSGTEEGIETVTSEIYTEVFIEVINNKKVYSKLRARVELKTGASISVYIKVDNGDFALVNTYTTTGLRVMDVNFAPRKCDHFQIKFVCSGNYRIYNLERRYTISGS